MRPNGHPRVVVFSELYWPEDTSTGFFLTGIAEGLAEEHDVLVFCAQPTYAKRGLRAARRERRAGVDIVRVASTTFGHERAAGRVLNALTVGGAIFLQALRHLRPADRVLVVTNPPTLPFLIALAARLKRAQTALLVHDVYPEVLEATGVIRSGGRVAGIIRRMAAWLYRNVDRIVVLGRDMVAVVGAHVDVAPPRVRWIPNWGDVEEIVPVPRQGHALLRGLSLDESFVVQWLGNMGRTHALEALLLAAARLREHPEVRFLFVGSGSRRAWLETEIARRALHNVTLLPSCQRAELCAHLGACDLAVIGLLPGMAGVSVPSRLYNVLAAGRPVLAIAEPESELSRVVREERVGWVVPRPAPGEIAEAVLEAAADSRSRAEMGARARRVAECRYSRGLAIRSWKRLFAEQWRG